MVKVSGADLIQARDTAIGCFMNASHMRTGLSICHAQFTMAQRTGSIEFGVEEFHGSIEDRIHTLHESIIGAEAANSDMIITAIEIALAKENRLSTQKSCDMEATTAHQLAVYLAARCLSLLYESDIRPNNPEVGPIERAEKMKEALAGIELPDAHQFTARIRLESALAVNAATASQSAATARYNKHRSLFNEHIKIISRRAKFTKPTEGRGGAESPDNRGFSYDREKLKATENEALLALGKMNAFSPRELVSSDKLAIEARIEPSSNFRDACKGLVDKGLASSMKGRGGGYWLTQAGKATYEQASQK